MPAFLAHYACGVVCCRDMAPGRLRDAIRMHSAVFGVGLAGPDLFFYSFYELLRPGMTLGRRIHKYRTQAFLRSMLHAALREKGEDKETALAYFAGFTGHYCLDAAAHPMIYRATERGGEKESLGRHFRFEAALDNWCCRKYLARPIKKSHQMGLIRMSRAERAVVARVMASCCTEVFGDVYGRVSPLRMRLLLREYRLITGLIVDPSGFREWVMTGLEKRLLGFPWSAPLFINHNTYGISEKSLRQFDVRFARGREHFSKALPLIEEASRGGAESEERLMRFLGNWSYHNGKEAEPL